MAEAEDPRPEEPARSARMGRRRWLRVGIGGAVALGFGGLFAWRTTGYSVPESVTDALRSLTPKEYAIVEAAAARIVRSDRPDDPTAEDTKAAAFVDAYVARLDEANRGDLKKLLHLLEHGLPVRAGHLGRFTRLGGSAQDEVLEAMRTSSIGLIRGGFVGLKTLCVMGYYRDPRTWRSIGYDGPLVGRPSGGWW